MNTTQQHVSIKDIKEDILILKDGGGALILQVGAVNFGLLSQREQMAIIGSFAQMLNSLSFSIQIVVHSERLNISSYLALLDKAMKAQTNRLLSQMMATYRQFIQTTIRENDVLDKKFYVVIPLFSLELGLAATKQALQQKIKTTLLPRRDQVIRQLSRVGLQATQLRGRELLELFYNIYNGAGFQSVEAPKLSTKQLEVNLKEPQKIETALPDKPELKMPEQRLNQPSVPPAVVTGQTRNHPFVVEELE